MNIVTDQQPIYTRLITHLNYAAILICFTVWHFTNGQGVLLTIWLAQCLPLLIFWPGMRAKHHRTYLWLCFVLLIYFIKAVPDVMSQSRDWLDISIVTLVVTTFIGSMLTSRSLQRTIKPSAH